MTCPTWSWQHAQGVSKNCDTIGARGSRRFIFTLRETENKYIYFLIISLLRRLYLEGANRTWSLESVRFDFGRILNSETEKESEWRKNTRVAKIDEKRRTRFLILENWINLPQLNWLLIDSLFKVYFLRLEELSIKQVAGYKSNALSLENFQSQFYQRNIFPLVSFTKSDLLLGCVAITETPCIPYCVVIWRTVRELNRNTWRARHEKKEKKRRPWCIHYDRHARGHCNCEQFLRQPESFSDEIETKRQLFTLRLRLDCFLFCFRFHCLASPAFSIISERHREKKKKFVSNLDSDTSFFPPPLPTLQ